MDTATLAYKVGPWIVVIAALGAIVYKPDLWNNAGFALIVGGALTLIEKPNPNG